MTRDALSTVSIRSGVTAEEVVAIALDNIGKAWTIDGCTDFVWGVTNLAGAPFFDLADKTIGGDPTLPDDVPYVVPHSAGIGSGTDDIAGDGWTSVYSGTSTAALEAALQPGDVVRVYSAGNTAEASLLPDGGYGAHSFIVTSVSEAGVIVADNWNGTQIVSHSLDDILAAFAPTGVFEAAFVSRLDEAYVTENIAADLAGNAFGDFSALTDAGAPGTGAMPEDQRLDDLILDALALDYAAERQTIATALAGLEEVKIAHPLYLGKLLDPGVWSDFWNDYLNNGLWASLGDWDRWSDLLNDEWEIGTARIAVSASCHEGLDFDRNEPFVTVTTPMNSLNSRTLPSDLLRKDVVAASSSQSCRRHGHRRHRAKKRGLPTSASGTRSEKGFLLGLGEHAARSGLKTMVLPMGVPKRMLSGATRNAAKLDVCKSRSGPRTAWQVVVDYRGVSEFIRGVW